MTSDAGHRELREALTVEPIGDSRYQGTCFPAWPGRAFGGQLAAQCLVAAAHGVPAGQQPWSLHAQFHAPVRANEPVEYVVEPRKDGRSVTARLVSVHQDDRLRGTALALFGHPAAGPQHQYRRPATVPPGRLAPEERLLHPSIVPEDADADALGYPPEAPVEMRVVPADPTHPDAGSQVWLRLKAPLPSDPVTVAAALCCYADLTLGTAALQPHGGRDGATGLQLGALELALWFTATPALDEWTLFSQDSSFAGHGHGLAHGVFFDSAGDVCAVALQNALMRLG